MLVCQSVHISSFLIFSQFYEKKSMKVKMKCSKLENRSQKSDLSFIFVFLLYTRPENRHFKVIINILQNQIICWHIDGQLYNKIGWCDLIICPDKKLSKCLSPFYIKHTDSIKTMTWLNNQYSSFFSSSFFLF